MYVLLRMVIIFLVDKEPKNRVSFIRAVFRNISSSCIDVCVLMISSLNSKVDSGTLFTSERVSEQVQSMLVCGAHFPLIACCHVEPGMHTFRTGVLRWPTSPPAVCILELSA